MLPFGLQEKCLIDFFFFFIAVFFLVTKRKVRRKKNFGKIFMFHIKLPVCRKLRIEKLPESSLVEGDRYRSFSCEMKMKM